MPRHSRFIIDGKSIPRGRVTNLNLSFSETYIGQSVSLPVKIVRAPKPGPRIFLTGAVHGDELTGIGIIRSLLFDTPFKLLRGTLICVPVVNLFGFEHGSRYLPDRRDLNRCFPGADNGSMTSRLASRLTTEIIDKCDFGIDFHTASGDRTNYPNIRGDMRDDDVKHLARSFGAELIVNNRGPKGSLRRVAIDRGTPTIMFEAGEVGKLEPGVVEYGVRGTLNILKAFDMIEGESESPLFQVSIQKTSWVRAERGGFLNFCVAPGDVVEEGQDLAINTSIFGSERNVLASPCHGVVLGMTTMPAVKPGEPVYHIARFGRKTYERLHKRIHQHGDGSLYKDVLRDHSRKIQLFRS